MNKISSRVFLFFFALMVLMTGLSGCGGGGSNPVVDTYTVGGTVTGLRGTLVLLNNGGDNLAITTNGAITFSTALTDDSAYNVTISSQSAGQTCTLNNASGAIISADITNITVTCVNKSWKHPVSLTDNISTDGQNAYEPQIAMDDNGNAIIIWEQYDGSFGQIFKSEYRGGIWSHPISLSDNISPDGAHADYPQVAIDNNGNAVIAWVQGSRILKSEYRNGVWTNPSSLADFINPDGSNAYGGPQVAMDNNGNSIIVLTQNVGSNLGIFKSEYRGGVWKKPSSLADSISPGSVGNYADAPQVAMDSKGNAIIVWEQTRNGTDLYVYKSEYRGGVWTKPSSTADYVSPGGSPQVEMDNNGNAIIVWSAYDRFSRHIYKSEYRNGVWKNPASLADYISPNGYESTDAYPQVAMDNNGNAIIAWSQSDGSSYQIFKSECRGGIWSHPISLSDNISPDGQIASSPQVAMDNNGNAIIVWSQSDGSSYQIFKSEYRRGTWLHPISLSDNISPDGQIASSPQVAMDNNGNAIIIWSQSDGSSYQIFKSEYR